MNTKFSKRIYGELGWRRKDLICDLTKTPTRFRMRTFEEWNRYGFHVRKYEKSSGRAPNGKPVFSGAQVKDVKLYDTPHGSEIDELLGTDHFGILS